MSLGLVELRAAIPLTIALSDLLAQHGEDSSYSHQAGAHLVMDFLVFRIRGGIGFRIQDLGSSI